MVIYSTFYLKHLFCLVWYENSKKSGEAIHSETGSSEYPTGSPEHTTGSPQHTTANSTIGPRSKKPSTKKSETSGENVFFLKYKENNFLF